MTTITTIKQRNKQFASERHAGYVCVFAGATSGIGAGTLERMALMLDAPTFYVLGRSAARFASQRAKLESLNPSCKIVFLETEVSLLSDVDTVCKQISSAEQKVDCLYMSQGMMPLNAPECTCLQVLKSQLLTGGIDTKEGLEMCFAISYYSRMRLVQNLLPLLRQSPRPRVLSVLNAGKEKAMNDEDIGLEQHWSTIAIINHTTTMMSLAFDHLAANDKHITFMHAYPGWVKTDIFTRLTAPESSGVAWRVTLASICGFVAVVMLLFAISTEESGERQAYQLTSDTYGPGALLIGYLSDQVPAPHVLEQYRERGWAEKVWEHTLRVFDKVLANGSDNVPK
jgi:NAD(P)-dependent dehydrogenase (short-subunit alcohol dehydrogenase family)